jgi:hypothetical protein
LACLASCAPRMASHTVFLYTYFLSRTACSPSKAACVPGLASCTPWGLQAQLLFLYFLSRAACAPGAVACILGLASRTPHMATYTVPLAVLSKPSGTCAERGHVTLSLAWCMPVFLHSQFNYLPVSRPSFMCADLGCMHAWLGVVCAPSGYTCSSTIVIF